jgi:hypothetical protein
MWSSMMDVILFFKEVALSFEMSSTSFFTDEESTAKFFLSSHDSMCKRISLTSLLHMKHVNLNSHFRERAFILFMVYGSDFFLAFICLIF